MKQVKGGNFNLCQHRYLMTICRPALRDGSTLIKCTCLRCGYFEIFSAIISNYSIISMQIVE